MRSGTHHGNLSQKFQIRVDVEALLTEIGDKIGDAIAEHTDLDCLDLYDFDDWDAIYDGTYLADYAHYWEEGTRYDPPVDEWDRFRIEDIESKLLDKIPKEIRKFIKLRRVDESEDNTTYYDRYGNIEN